MNPQSPSLAIDETVLKESDDLDILGVTFDYKKNHLRSVLDRFSKARYLEELTASIR